MRTGGESRGTGRSSPSLLSTAGILAGLMLAVGLTGGVARAGMLPRTGHVTAAEDQYGGHRILKPAKPHTFTPPKVKPSSATPAPASKPTTTAAPAASTAGTLPYTGLALLKVVLFGLGLLALGFALHRWPSRRRNRHDA
jgi:hypothetical protein